MKTAHKGLLVFVLSALFFGDGWAGQVSEVPEKLLGSMIFLPADDDIPGWKRSEKILSASNAGELYTIFNGGASLYIQYGFRSLVAQNYKGPKGMDLEVYIFDQGTPQNTEDLYENPFNKPSRSEELVNLGRKARIDLSPLFCYGVDFVSKRFFVRIIIQEKTEEALHLAVAFARSISNRIQGFADELPTPRVLGARRGLGIKAGILNPALDGESQLTEVNSAIIFSSEVAAVRAIFSLRCQGSNRCY